MCKDEEIVCAVTIVKHNLSLRADEWQLVGYFYLSFVITHYMLMVGY